MNEPTYTEPQCNECVFVEEQEPSGRRVLPPCITCGITAMDALEQTIAERDARRTNDQHDACCGQAYEEGYQRGVADTTGGQLWTRPASVTCGRCDAVFVEGGGRLSIERFRGDYSAPEVGTNGLCENCLGDGVAILSPFLMPGTFGNDGS